MSRQNLNELFLSLFLPLWRLSIIYIRYLTTHFQMKPCLKLAFKGRHRKKCLENLFPCRKLILISIGLQIHLRILFLWHSTDFPSNIFCYSSCMNNQFLHLCLYIIILFIFLADHSFSVYGHITLKQQSFYNHWN